MHIGKLLRHIQAYSGIFSTQCNTCIPVDCFKPFETLTKHIQNPAMGHYLVLFRHIKNLMQRLHTQKPGIL